MKYHDEEIRGDVSKRGKLYACPWCNHITSNVERAKRHSLTCKKKNAAGMARH